MPVKIPVDRRIFAKIRPWVFIVAALTLTFVATVLLSKVENTWPLGPFAWDHPIANTFGEIVGFTAEPAKWSWRQHFGLDILATPCTDAQCTNTPTRVVASVSGKCTGWLPPLDEATNNVVYIDTADGHRYEYMHLHAGTTRTFMESYTDDNDECMISAKETIGGIHDAFPLEYDHLHYGITHSKYDINNQRIITNKNPLRMISPDADFIKPVISGVHFVHHKLPRWTEFGAGTSDDCATLQTLVSGKVDILVEVSDRDDAGSPLAAASHVGVYNLEWRACPIGNQNCAWNDTHAYETMPAEWNGDNNPTLSKRFSWESPCITQSEDWIQDASGGAGKTPRSCMIIGKNTGAATWNASGDASWDTLAIPDGNYALSVRATDMAGLEAVWPLNGPLSVCVENGKN